MRKWAKPRFGDRGHGLALRRLDWGRYPETQLRSVPEVKWPDCLVGLPLGPAGNHHFVKGDRVEVIVDAGDRTREFEVSARRAGRRVETRSGRGVVEVTEVTRTGQPVRTARFMASRVIALVERPAADLPTSEPVPVRAAARLHRAS